MAPLKKFQVTAMLPVTKKAFEESLAEPFNFDN
jgi:hypothetical protein